MTSMDLGMSERVKPLHARVKAMVVEEIAPLDEEFLAEVGRDGDRWSFTARQTEILEGLKAKARERGLWNFWRTGQHGSGLTTVEYAYLAEEMGRSHLAAEVFNCSAPDTGNMEVLEKFGTAEHKERWLEPLLDGTIRSAFLMTEPDVASSDATNISMSCKRDGDSYVLSGEKWWASGAGDPRCALYIVMVRTGNGESRHTQHSMILVEPDRPGIMKLRPMSLYGDDDAPHGHLHMRFDEVRVPASNLLLGEGRGFEIAQGRLGPGRIHHCMRGIGQAELALDMMCKRALERTAFGQPLARLGGNVDIIADARIEIEMARLLCLKAAWYMDQGDPVSSALWISKAKVAVPIIGLKIVDQAVQLHGGMGVSQDTPLARVWTHLRAVRLADGPDAVHRRQVARHELAKHRNA